MSAGRLTLAALLVAALPAAAARAADYPCGGDYRPLEKTARLPDLLGLFVPPLAILDALTRDSLADKPRRPVTLKLSAADGRPAPAGSRIGVVLDDGKRFLADIEAGRPLALPDGRYTVVAAAVGATIQWGEARLDVGAKRANAAEIKLDRSLPAATAKPAAAGGPAGSTTTVDWDGFPGPAGRLVTVKLDAGGKPAEAVGEWDGEDRPATLELPATVGAHEIRLTLCAPRLTLARWPVRVTPAEIALAAPERVPAGTGFQVTASGRLGVAYRIVLTRRGAKPDDDPLAEGTGEQGWTEVTLQAPLDPGNYEIRYLTKPAGTVLARRPVAVEAAAAEIVAPEVVAALAPIDVSWTGEGGRTSVELWTLGTQGKPGRRILRSVSKRAARLPATGGRYELRLVDPDKPGKVFARRDLTIEGGVILRATERTNPLGGVEIDLAAKGGFFDKIAIVPRGAAYDPFAELPEARAPDGPSFRLTAPRKPGAYDLIYVSDEPGEDTIVVERRKLEVR